MLCAASQNGLDSGVPLLPTVQGSLKASVITVTIVAGSAETNRVLRITEYIVE